MAGVPHQAAALAQAGRAVERHVPGFGRDLHTALTRAPELARGAGTEDDSVAALIQAGRAEGLHRTALEQRGRAAVRAWDTLEREYEAAGKAYERDAQRTVGTRMEAFAKELKRDPQLDSLLRQRGRELGVAKGSRLDRVVRAREIDRALTRDINLEHGMRHSRRPGLGM